MLICGKHESPSLFSFLAVCSGAAAACLSRKCRCTELRPAPLPFGQNGSFSAPKAHNIPILFSQALGYPPLHTLVATGDEEALLAALARPPEELKALQSETGRDGFSALHVACVLGRVSFARHLAAAGWSLSARSSDGRTPVQCTPRQDQAAMALALESVQLGQLPGKPQRSPAVSATRGGGAPSTAPPPGGTPKTAPPSTKSAESATDAAPDQAPARPTSGLSFPSDATRSSAQGGRRPSRKAPPSLGGGRFNKAEFGQLTTPLTGHSVPASPRSASPQATGAPATAGTTPGVPPSVVKGGSSPALGGEGPLQSSSLLPPARRASSSVPSGGVAATHPSPPLSPGRPPQGSVPGVKKSRRPSMQLPALGAAKPAKGRRVRRSSGYSRSSIKRASSVSIAGTVPTDSPQDGTPRDPPQPAPGNEGGPTGVQLMEPPPAGRRKHPLGAPSVTANRSRGPLEGFDFTSGVSMAGTLAIQAPHGKYKWWLKHFVLSESEQALFFWTGTADEATSLAKRISMASVSKIAREADRRKDGSRMFVLGVTSGATLRLAAGTPREAQLWVSALHALCGPHVAVTSISRVFRGWTGRRMLLLVAGGMQAQKAQAAMAADARSPSARNSAPQGEQGGAGGLPGSPVATRRRSESATNMAAILVDSSAQRSGAGGSRGRVRAGAAYGLHPDVALVGPTAPYLVQSWAQRISVSSLSTAAHKIGCASALASFLFDAVVPPSRRQSVGGGGALHCHATGLGGAACRTNGRCGWVGDTLVGGSICKWRGGRGGGRGWTVGG